MAALFERMKAAWDSRVPDALDREAEDMARRGVAETDIYAALEELLLAVRSSGADDETEERINEVMDRLTGWCHPASQIRTTRSDLPSEEEIAALPRWARVAFAARCARRVAILRVHFKPDSESTLVDDKAIGYVERRAGKPHTAVTGTLMVNGVAVKDYDAPSVFDGTDVMEALTHAGSNAVWAGNAAADHAQTALTAHTTGAAVDAAFAARQGLPGWERAIVAAIRRDFDHLASLARWQHWTDDTPVPPEVFGPLWPEGPPKGWPPVTDAPPRTELALELFPRGRATDRMIEDDIVHLFNTLNRYHIARSGVRLTLEQFRSLLPAVVPAEV